MTRQSPVGVKSYQTSFCITNTPRALHPPGGASGPARLLSKVVENGTAKLLDVLQASLTGGHGSVKQELSPPWEVPLLLAQSASVRSAHEPSGRQQATRQEFGGPHNYALARTVAFLAGEIEQSTNARWTDDRDTFEQLNRAIETVLKGVETPKAVVASASSRAAGPPARKGRFSLGRAFALGLLHQVELVATKGGQESQPVSRLLRLASELAPALGPLLERTPHMSGVRFVSGAVEVEPKAQNKR